MTSKCVRILAFCAFAVTVAGLDGCKSNEVQAGGVGSTEPMSGPPTFNEHFHARNARVCRTVTTPPTPEEAKALVQCDHEAKSDTLTRLLLVTNLQVRMSAPRPYSGGFNQQDIDVKSVGYDLRGQGTAWDCGKANGMYPAGKNCMSFTAVPNKVGSCWHTTFNDWRCSMGVGGPEYDTLQPGPTEY